MRANRQRGCPAAASSWAKRRALRHISPLPATGAVADIDIGALQRLLERGGAWLGRADAALAHPGVRDERIMKARLWSAIFAALALAGLSFATPAAAQDWPVRPVKIMIPFGPGSTPDLVGRLIADRLQQKLGQPFVVEDKPGASGNLGTDAVAKAEPDGYTLGISIGGPLAINPLLFCQDAVRSRRRISPSSPCSRRSRARSRSTPGSASNTVAELIALLKKNPGKYNFGSIGNGSLSHLAMEAIALKSGTQIVHVPYASSPQAMTALLRDDVQIVCLPAISVTPQVGVGRREDSRGVDRDALGAVAGRPDAQGSRHRRRGRRLDGPDRAGEDAGRHRRADRPRGRRR